jgi:hypothetical protein
MNPPHPSVLSLIHVDRLGEAFPENQLPVLKSDWLKIAAWKK